MHNILPFSQENTKLPFLFNEKSQDNSLEDIHKTMKSFIEILSKSEDLDLQIDGLKKIDYLLSSVNDDASHVATLDTNGLKQEAHALHQLKQDEFNTAVAVLTGMISGQFFHKT